MKPNGIKCTCAVCSKTFIRLPSRLKRHGRSADAPVFCTHVCYLVYKKEHRVGCINPLGYHQISIECKSILVHRLIMEKHLGRKLLNTEVVHHKNENRSDNHIDNLILEASNAEHLRHHGNERWNNAEAAFLYRNGVIYRQIAESLGANGPGAVGKRLRENGFVLKGQPVGKPKTVDEIMALRAEFAAK